MLNRRELMLQKELAVEKIVYIPLIELHPFPNHPYGIREDQAMQDTVDSVKQNGVVVPAIVRPRTEGGYEIVAGHRRKLASERAGFTDMPCIVRNLTDDEAIIQLVDSNAQREDVLPSERAKAYKMRLDAIKRTAGRPPRQAQENVPNNSANFRSDDEVGNTDGISGDTVRNIISLNNLVPELMQMVDDKKISLTPAYQIAALTEPEQRILLETMDSEQATPSVSQAQRMRRLSQTGELNEDNMLQIMMEQKKPPNSSITIPLDKLRKYFPKSYSPARMEETIFKLLDQWLKHRQRSAER
jgi:ParB family chromosome partitioning protein